MCGWRSSRFPRGSRLAARGRDSADLGRALRMLGLAGSRPARAVDALVQFHLGLVEASCNPVFVAMYESLRGPIALSPGRRCAIRPGWRRRGSG